MPERTPLKGRVTGTLDREGYRVEKVIYESRPDHHVTGNLYLPKEGKPPYPGVLVPCGHSHNGKAYNDYQAVSILLATHGFVVLCYDPIGQGERIQTFDEKGEPAAWGTTEHTLTDIGAAGGDVRGELPDLGRHPLDRLPGEPAGGGPEADRVHGELGRRDADVLPDDHRRPDRSGGAVVLRDVAGAAVRDDRAAGRRAEHPGAGRTGDRARGLPVDASAEADAHPDGGEGLLRQRRDVDEFPGGEAAGEHAGPERVRGPVRGARGARVRADAAGGGAAVDAAVAPGRGRGHGGADAPALDRRGPPGDRERPGRARPEGADGVGPEPGSGRGGRRRSARRRATRQRRWRRCGGWRGCARRRGSRT